MSKLAYANKVIKALEARVDKINKIIESADNANSRFSEDEIHTFYVQRRAFKDSIRLAKTIYTKMRIRSGK